MYRASVQKKVRDNEDNALQCVVHLISLTQVHDLEGAISADDWCRDSYILASRRNIVSIVGQM